MPESQQKRKVNTHASVLIALHVLLLVYSLCGFFSKNASRQPFMSFEFCAFYAGMLIILFIYAIGWQQILKRIPLTVAFANKAVTVIWGIVWGAVFFQEPITPPMIAGAALVMGGIVLFSIADGEQRREEEAALRAEGGSGALETAGAAHVPNATETPGQAVQRGGDA